MKPTFEDSQALLVAVINAAPCGAFVIVATSGLPANGDAENTAQLGVQAFLAKRTPRKSSSSSFGTSCEALRRTESQVCLDAPSHSTHRDSRLTPRGTRRISPASAGRRGDSRGFAP